LSLIPWEGEKSTSLRDLLQQAPQDAVTETVNHEQRWPPFAINLFIGPEGGFTPDEIAIARRYGLVPVTLGPRILRAETASVAAAATILYELGDLG
jgi:16S rRNA (uracil1498-N3)-methyltransferase